jgi:hypothetical protein
MHLTLLVAGALIPEQLSTAVTASCDLPCLQARLAHARLIGDSGPSSETGDAHLDWLARALFGQTPAPTAPYAYAQLSGEIPHAFLWHADPMHIMVASDHLVAHRLDVDAPATDESEQLIEVANGIASDIGCELVRVGSRWFLRCEQDWQIDARPLGAAIGAPVVMPAGADAHIWNRLHNEIQMAWHMHPVNQAREERQQRAINGIWLHGGGRWKPLTPIRYTQIQADAPDLQGAAHAAGASGVPLDAETIDSSLLVIDQPVQSKKFEDWHAWSKAMTGVDRRLVQHSGDSIDLILCGRTARTYRSQRSDRYALWRRRTLAQALAE